MFLMSVVTMSRSHSSTDVRFLPFGLGTNGRKISPQMKHSKALSRACVRACVCVRPSLSPCVSVSDICMQGLQTLIYIVARSAFPSHAQQHSHMPLCPLTSVERQYVCPPAPANSIKCSGFLYICALGYSPPSPTICLIIRVAFPILW